MPVFLYQGITRGGIRRRGELSAKNQIEAAQLLRKRGVAHTHLKEKPVRIPFWFAFPLGSAVTGRELFTFPLQFSAMIKAGIPLVSCLETLTQNIDHRRFRRTLEDVRLKVEEGSTLADALRSHPDVFPETYVGLVAAGEAGGMLDQVLLRLADHLQKIMHLKKRVTGALAYPLLILLLAGMVMVFLLLWVIPIFGDLFADFGSALPWPTQVVLTLSQFVHEHIGSLFIGLILSVYGMNRVYAIPKGRMIVDRFMLRVPLIGDLLRKSAVVRVTKTLSSWLRSGVSVLEALDLASKTSGNRVIETGLQEVRTSLGEGKTISEPLAHSGVFPPLVTHMIAVGESTGALDSMLENIADLYEEEVGTALTSVTSVLEPLVIVAFGLGIGFIVVAMYLPIFPMSSLVGAM